jgi:phosphoribosylformylglycinamidine synthase subunit PurQ / glutaminase
MTQVAIIVSPGHNTEIETYRELLKVGLDTKIFRWNEDPAQILNAKSFLIPGGFSYEDRGRSGLISAQNPIMQAVKEQVLNGKPLIGICNGAQATVELALVPGDQDNTKALALAKNKREKDGEILGTGYYNTMVYLKRAVPANRTPYTLLVSDDPIPVPVAHGEGRYTTVYPELPQLLLDNQQVVFQYCTEQGQVVDEFPTNPNGAMLSAAAICNAQGNVLSIMPHPERGLVAPVADMFASLKKYLEEKPKLISFPAYKLSPQDQIPKSYTPEHTQLVVRETITDNEAYTLSNTLNKLLNKEIKLERFTHFEIEATDQEIAKVRETGELYNSNKQEEYSSQIDESQDFALLVRYSDDFEGKSKQDHLNKHYQTTIKSLKKGTIWHFKNVDADTKQQILDTGLFYNINSQTAYEYL